MLMVSMMIDSPEERSKLEKIYLAYNRLMYQTAYEVLHSREDAEDAVHNALLKIAENISKVDTPISSKARNYVVTITMNKAIDLYRANQRKKNMLYRDEVFDSVIEEMGLSELATCMAKLPSRYRQVIVLKYYYGLSHKEIGKKLRITEANASKLIQRAKNRLHRYCREEGLL